MNRLGFKHDFVLVKAFMLMTPCCEQLGHDLVCADQIMTAVEIKAEAITKLAGGDGGLQRNPEIIRVAAGIGSAEDYKTAILRLNGYIFGSWDAMLKHAIRLETKDEPESKIESIMGSPSDKIRFDCEQRLEKAMGTDIFQLPCGYWVEFI